MMVSYGMERHGGQDFKAFGGFHEFAVKALEAGHDVGSPSLRVGVGGRVTPDKSEGYHDDGASDAMLRPWVWMTLGR